MNAFKIRTLISLSRLGRELASHRGKRGVTGSKAFYDQEPSEIKKASDDSASVPSISDRQEGIIHACTDDGNDEKEESPPIKVCFTKNPIKEAQKKLEHPPNIHTVSPPTSADSATISDSIVGAHDVTNSYAGEDFGPHKDIVLGTRKLESVVCKAQHKDGKPEYAAKILDSLSYPHSDKELSNIQKFRDSVNLLQYIHHWKYRQRLVITMQLCDSHLKKYMDDWKLQSKLNLSPLEVAKQLIEETYQLHYQHACVHREIKPTNFLLKIVNGSAIVKVCDFVKSFCGLSRIVNTDQSTTESGTTAYMAPEVLERFDGRERIKITEKNKKSDIFLFGLVLFYILTNGKHPYGDKPIMQAYNITKNNKDMMLLFNDDVSLTEEQKINFCSLIWWMLEHKPEDRPSIEDVKRHPSFWSYWQKVIFLEEVANNIPGPTTKRAQGSQVSPSQTASDAICSTGSSQSLEHYHAWMSAKFWLTEPEKRPDRDILLGFDIQQNTVEDLILKMPNPYQKQQKCDSVEALLKLMRNKKQHAKDYDEDIRRQFGLGDKKDWEKYYTYFTKKYPQILLRCHQVYGNTPAIRDFIQNFLSR